MARLKLKPRNPSPPSEAVERAAQALRDIPATTRRAHRKPAPGMPEKPGFVGPGNARGTPGYAGQGEPSHYRPEYIPLMYAFFDRDPWEVVEDAKGTPRMMPKDKLPTMQRFARQIGYSTDTLHKWADKFPEFGAAYAECKEMQKAFIMESGGLTLNGGFAAFMLRCNHGMRDEAPKEEAPDDTITEILIKVDNGPHRN